MTACVGTTGGQVVTFDAEASGPSDVVAGKPLAFDTVYSSGTKKTTWNVVLTKATLHVGAIYTSQTTSVSGEQNVSCFLPGTYSGEVTSGVDIDLLSPAATKFSGGGEGTTLPGESAQVWLTQGDVNLIDVEPPILVLEGTATSGTDIRPFTAGISIEENRLGSGTAIAGANPICKQRIIAFASPITLSQGGTLHLTVDPRLLFTNMDFSALAFATTGSGYAFKDDSSDQPSTALYGALRSASTSLYSLQFTAN